MAPEHTVQQTPEHTLPRVPDHPRASTDAPDRSAPGPERVLPGLLLVPAGVLLAVLAHEMVPAVGVLTWAVGLGALAATLRLLPPAATPGLRLATRRLLRAGIVLLGLSLSLSSIATLGLPLVALVVVTLVTTLLTTFWLGTRMGLGRPRSLLIGTGFAICGASAIAAMEEHADAQDDDVAAAIAMVTLCGTVAVVALPLLQVPLGLDDRQLGVWAGASVHEVGQVVAAAGPAGAAAVAVAVVVKLTRVLLLAPVVACVSLLRRRRQALERTAGVVGALPPLVPGFVLAFLVCVGLRSTGVLPEGLLTLLGHLQTVVLSGGLFAMGTGVDLRRLLRGGGITMTVSALSTLLVAGISLAGIRVLG